MGRIELIVAAVAVFVILGLPWLFYVCAKVAAVGYLRGRKLFDETEGEKHGEDEKRTR